ARRAATAVSVLALAASMIGTAYADGKYVAQMSIPVGQAPQCADIPKSVEVDVEQGRVTAADDLGKCVGPLKADGTFNCSFATSRSGTATFSGHVAGSAIDGAYQRVFTPPLPARGGFTCHATFKGKES
ncbi:MAG TPA: hypothetical protein VJR47_21665, partial [Stellaceae bacterium]|nr:hypothetical protein [Stellaceae bacterium]